MFYCIYSIIGYIYSSNMNCLVSIGIKRRILLPICMNQGGTKSSFLCLLMLTLHDKSPPYAARQGCLYLWIIIPSIGIAIVRQLLNQELLEQSYVTWRQVWGWLRPYITSYKCLEYQYMDILICSVITRPFTIIPSRPSLSWIRSIIPFPNIGAGR